MISATTSVNSCWITIDADNGGHNTTSKSAMYGLSKAGGGNANTVNYSISVVGKWK